MCFLVSDCALAGYALLLSIEFETTFRFDYVLLKLINDLFLSLYFSWECILNLLPASILLLCRLSLFYRSSAKEATLLSCNLAFISILFWFERLAIFYFSDCIDFNDLTDSTLRLSLVILRSLWSVPLKTFLLSLLILLSFVSTYFSKLNRKISGKSILFCILFYCLGWCWSAAI